MLLSIEEHVDICSIFKEHFHYTTDDSKTEEPPNQVVASSMQTRTLRQDVMMREYGVEHVFLQACCPGTC